MPRHRIRTLLILTATTWLVAVASAICGMLLANLRIADSYVPSKDNLWFAVVCGLTSGLLSSGLAAAILADDGVFISPKKWLPIAWLAMAIASAGSLYVFARSSAAI